MEKKQHTKRKRKKETFHRLDQDCKRGLGWSHIDSTYETIWVDDGFGETKKEAPTPEPVCKSQAVEDM